MLTDDDFIDLNSKFNTSCKPSSRIFTLLTVPFGLFMVVVLCYLGYFPLKMELHSVILIGFIFLAFVGSVSWIILFTDLVKQFKRS